ADGSLDLVVANEATDDVSVFRGASDGTFQPEVRYHAGDSPESLAAADFDRDGKLDVAVGNLLSKDISILYGRGDATFDLQVRVSSGIEGSSLAAGDLDGDGLPDLAVANSPLLAQISAGASLHGNGDRTFGQPVDLMIPDIAAVAARDTDRDGVDD